MSQLMAEWRAKKAQEKVQEDGELHERLRAAVLTKQVEIYTDQRMLDFQGSPVHNAWDHLMPLMVMMLLALVVLLATGVAIGIVAMTLGALAHLLGIKHFVAWRIRIRAVAYLLESAAHWNHLWQLGGVALYIPGGTEPPCLAPRGDWRKFARRNLFDVAQPAPLETAGAKAAGAEAVENSAAGMPQQEVLPP